MFKFKFIKGQRRKTNNPLVDLMHYSSSCLKENNNSLENQDKTTLVIMDEKEQNIVGGTYLSKRELEHFQEDVRRLLPTGTFDPTYVWECYNICFSHSHHLPFQSSSPENLLRNFYHRLYEGLVEFGKQKRIGFVVVKLNPEAYTLRTCIHESKKVIG